MDVANPLLRRAIKRLLAGNVCSAKCRRKRTQGYAGDLEIDVSGKRSTMKLINRSRSAGFTILELLVSLALIAVLVNSLAGGLHLGRRAWETARTGEELDDGEAAMHGVSVLISKAFSVSAVNNQRVVQLIFIGDAHNLEFVSLSEGEAQRGGLILTQLGVKSGKKTALHLWTALYRANTALAMKREDMRDDMVLDGIGDFKLAYFGADIGQLPQWKDLWQNQQSMPKLISIRFTIERRGQVKALETTIFLPLS